MPHSPFTRFLAIVIVAAHAVILLWPDPRAQAIGLNALMGLPFLLMLFTWSAVRDAPVFNDHAFHRTLPTDDAQVFRRTLRIHGMVLLGIALVVVIYCLLLNFGWQVTTYGMAMLTVPVWVFMSLFGTAMTASTSNEDGKSWGYIAMFAVPVLSMLLLYNVRRRLFFSHGDFYFFNPLIMAVLAGAVLYPFCWWLVAARRRRTAGLVAGMTIGVLMPWFFTYGGFAGYSHASERDVPVKESIMFTKKAGATSEGKWLRAESLLDVEGLRDGEYLELKKISSRNGRELQMFQLPDDPAVAEAGAYQGRVLVGKTGGGDVQWGKRAIWNHLRKEIPTHETFTFWNPRLAVPMHPAVLKEGKSSPILGIEEWTYGKPQTAVQTTGEDPAATMFRFILGDVYRMEKVGEVGMEKGGSCRLPETGIIRVSAPELVDKRYQVRIRKFSEGLSEDDAPWFKRKPYDDGVLAPWAIAVDESGKQAFALGSFLITGNSPDILLGEIDEWSVDLGRAETPETAARLEILRKCRLHVFLPKWVRGFQQMTVPEQHD